MKNIPRDIKDVDGKFIRKCILICWFMVIQDPPVVLGQEALAGETFNPDNFREYTSTGVTVEYTVWLPLLLCENGAILCKGVAQPVKKKIRSKSAPPVRRLQTNASHSVWSESPSEENFSPVYGKHETNRETDGASKYSHQDNMSTTANPRNYSHTFVPTRYTGSNEVDRFRQNTTDGVSRPTKKPFTQKNEDETSSNDYKYERLITEYDRKGAPITYYKVIIKGLEYAQYGEHSYPLDKFRRHFGFSGWKY